jgi:hypothetical protein
MKIIVFWDVASCSLVDVSEVLAASNMRSSSCAAYSSTDDGGSNYGDVISIFVWSGPSWLTNPVLPNSTITVMENEEVMREQR